MVHVGRRIDCAQCPIEIRWVKIERHVDAARQQRLKAVAGADVFLDSIDVRHETLLVVARVAINRRRTEIRRHWVEPYGFPQTREDLVELRGRVVVQPAELRVAGALGNGHGDNRPSAPAQIVENHQGPREDKTRIRRPNAVRRTMRKLLD